MKINLWSGPRNVSTALMYAFAQRGDTRVTDEPLYAHYLHLTGAQHPGRKEILAAMDSNGERVVRDVLLAAQDRPVLFVKNMAHHFLCLSWDFLGKMTNVMLIRDPEQMLPSLINQVPKPQLADTALARQTEIFDYLKARGRSPCVLDAKELLLNPEHVLRQLCTHVGLEFDAAMLSWPSGGRPEDGIWAPHWYHVIRTTTGFGPYRPKTSPFPAFLRPLLEECRPHYAYLYEHALKC